ncbi:MAG TPA: DDE transposase [Sedimenticola thiotaurini]|uniref:DDE transposase n=1 Tax=Sedimenticola thiotaurini TaxID=1543721 RepID=A0A831RJL6_9GAMM|nr:DDE transposase [Sedimenticola thiotaurini]
MPRFKDANYGQVKMIPISFDRRILPDSFEFTLSRLIDNEPDLSRFQQHYSNDETGRTACDPAILLKIIILAYSKGITSSRKIERLCRENILFMAISADSQPHFTTLANFVSRFSEEIGELFNQIVLVCDELGLIGREMFAVDGCKMPSNAAREWSGRHADLNRKRKKIDRAVRYILKKHKEADQANLEEALTGREKSQIKKLRQASRKIRRFLEENDCAGCRLRKRCLRDPSQRTARQIHIRLGISEERKQGLIGQMKRKIDSRAGRDIYSRRMGIVEPVFAHIGNGIGFRQSSLRGRRKVDGQ